MCAVIVTCYARSNENMNETLSNVRKKDFVIILI
jgi:hypothetical protein